MNGKSPGKIKHYPKLFAGHLEGSRGEMGVTGVPVAVLEMAGPGNSQSLPLISESSKNTLI